MESEAGQLPLSHKAWAWFEANKKPAILGTGALMVVGVIVSFFVYRQGQEDLAASQALSDAMVPQLMGAAGQGQSAQAYLKVAATYPKTSAAARALLLAAGSLFAEGKYAEAKTQFDRFTREHRDSSFMGQALLGVAACEDAQGKTKEAMMAYKNVIDHHPGENVVAQARFALGCLHEAQNDPEKARTEFESVARENPYGSLGSEAGMRLEELKIKYPKLTPVTPAPTSPVPYKIEKK
jgi:TolA-binding protein